MNSFFDDFKNEFNHNYFNKACWDILGEEYTGKEYQLRKIVKKKDISHNILEKEGL